MSQPNQPRRLIVDGVMILSAGIHMISEPITFPVRGVSITPLKWLGPKGQR